jgi:predicted DCC family thiol-disulfide oxidoreductase YuxK
MLPVTGITILYDAGCGICTHTRAWIEQQEPLVRIRFHASGSPEAKREFPQLPPGELAVVGNTGEVWVGNHAWIVCLWALRGYRDLAFRLTSPLLLRMAREAFSMVSKNRAALSVMLRLRSEREIENQLREVIVPRCQTSHERWLE